jgi:LacI family transcriptional regulator
MSDARPGRPTMKSVAAMADVSAMTVSRVLQGDPHVLPETRRRVLEAVDQLGYRRDEMARRLRVGKPAGMVGLIVSNLANPFYSQLALGVESVLAAHGLRLVLGNSGDDVERERGLVSDFLARRVDGMAVVPAGNTHQHLAPSQLHGVPAVLSARPPVDVQLDCVLLDDYGGARAAVEWLLNQGHTRVAFLGPPAAWTSAERLRGFRDSLADAGLPSEERYICVEQRDVKAAEFAASRLLSLREPPTAIFCANSRNTIGAYRAQHGGATTVSLAGFDDFDLADMLDAPLAVVTYDAQDMGRRTAQLLLDRIDGKNEDPRRIVLPTSLRTFEDVWPRRAPARIEIDEVNRR